VAPRTQYARNGDVSIAYQVVGDGPMDLLLSFGFATHVELIWEEPGMARFLTRLGRVGRMILYDRRGTGLSDPVPGTSVDVHVADLRAVLDAAGSRRAALIAYTNGGPPCIAFAHDHPERVSHLVLYGSFASNVQTDEVTWALAPAERSAVFDAQIQTWGEGGLVDRVAPNAADDPRLRDWFARLERQSASPGTVRAVIGAGVMDVSDLLPRIQVPTLIVHRTDDTLMDVRHARMMAAHIPGARLVELPGSDSLPSVGDSLRLMSEIVEFVSGSPVTGLGERALRTVLFTDIVEATRQASRMGDARWRDVLAAHDATTDRLLERYAGWRVKGTGDGVLATFAGLPSDAVQCAAQLVGELEDIGLAVRAGLHTGECELIGEDVGGMAVHIGARVMALAGAGEVLVSGTTYGTAVGAGLRFESRGEQRLKGVPGPWPVFALRRT
jgi:class 3 adenylate cyclase